MDPSENFVGYFARIITIANRVREVPPEHRNECINKHVEEFVGFQPPQYKAILHMTIHAAPAGLSLANSALICIKRDIEFFVSVFERASLNLR